jgi:uncharacterized protein with PIN domain
MFNQKKCTKCNVRDLIEIGEKVDASVPGINDTTIYSFHQCKKCGSIWIEIKESGAGGHGHFHHNLSEKYF